MLLLARLSCLCVSMTVHAPTPLCLHKPQAAARNTARVRHASNCHQRVFPVLSRVCGRARVCVCMCVCGHVWGYGRLRTVYTVRTENRRTVHACVRTKLCVSYMYLHRDTQLCSAASTRGCWYCMVTVLCPTLVNCTGSVCNHSLSLSPTRRPPFRYMYIEYSSSCQIVVLSSNPTLQQIIHAPSPLILKKNGA